MLKEVNSIWLVFEVRVEGLALVKAEPDFPMFAFVTFQVGRAHEEVDQVDGQGPAFLEPEWGDWEGRSDVILDPEFVNSGQRRSDAKEEDKSHDFRHCDDNWNLKCFQLFTSPIFSFSRTLSLFSLFGRFCICFLRCESLLLTF